MSDTTPRLRITRRSGKVRVLAEPGAALSVDGGSYAESEDGTVEIRAHGGATLEVRCAAGSDLTISTSSGKVDVRGDAGSVKVITKSGDVKIERATAVNARGASGRVEVGATDDAEVKTVSGKVTLGARGGGQLAARSISGSVDISVPDGSRPETRLKAVSGRVRCDCEPGHDGEIRAKSVSGSISVTCR